MAIIISFDKTDGKYIFQDKIDSSDSAFRVSSNSAFTNLNIESARQTNKMFPENFFSNLLKDKNIQPNSENQYTQALIIFYNKLSDIDKVSFLRDTFLIYKLAGKKSKDVAYLLLDNLEVPYECPALHNVLIVYPNKYKKIGWLYDWFDKNVINKPSQPNAERKTPKVCHSYIYPDHVDLQSIVSKLSTKQISKLLAFTAIKNGEKSIQTHRILWILTHTVLAIYYDSNDERKFLYSLLENLIERIKNDTLPYDFISSIVFTKIKQRLNCYMLSEGDQSLKIILDKLNSQIKSHTNRNSDNIPLQNLQRDVTCISPAYTAYTKYSPCRSKTFDRRPPITSKKVVCPKGL